MELQQQRPVLLQLEVLASLFPQMVENEPQEPYKPSDPDEFLGYDDLSFYGDGRDYDVYCQSAWGV